MHYTEEDIFLSFENFEPYRSVFASTFRNEDLAARPDLAQAAIMPNATVSTSTVESCIEDKCLGIKSLKLCQVQPALEAFRIRDMDAGRVRKLKDKIQTDRKLSSILTVVVIQMLT